MAEATAVLEVYETVTGSPWSKTIAQGVKVDPGALDLRPEGLIASGGHIYSQVNGFHSWPLSRPSISSPRL